MINPGIDGKVALVTGANHGIGAATAEALAAQGVRTFITYFREPSSHGKDELGTAEEAGVGGVLLYAARHQQSADRVVSAIEERGGTAASQEADLSDPANIPLLFDACEKALGPVEILVNNHTYAVMDTIDPSAVSTEAFPVGLLSPDVIDAHFVVNARAYALMMSEFVQRHRRRNASWGRIINTSTDAAHAHPSALSYAAGKHAIESYSRSAAIELGKYGITVNIMAPGPVQTGWLTPDQEASIAESTPLGRCGEPEDVADVAVFLASEQAHWLTGQLLYVGGGWKMHQ